VPRRCRDRAATVPRPCRDRAATVQGQNNWLSIF
jgi:hypothetical protein